MNPQQTIDELITTAVREGGSDIHMSAGRLPSIRVSGQLIQLVKQTIPSNEDMKSIVAVLIGNEDKMTKFIENQEADFSYDFKGEVRMRGNAYVQKGMLSVALRIIPKVKALAL